MRLQALHENGREDTRVVDEYRSGRGPASQIDPSRVNVDRYFQRIGYSGPRSATFDTLRALVFHHTTTIPFENLDPLLRRPLRLDAASLERKLVSEGRGGYCYEQNLLLKNVLDQLGFAVTGLAARVMWNVPEGVLTPRSHMLLLVEVESIPYLVDVGFGGQTPTAPLRLDLARAQDTPHGPCRVVLSSGTFTTQARVGDGWKSLYRFDLQEQHLPDYEIMSWYLSNHPDSHFVTGLIAARPDIGRRYTLRNNEFSVRTVAGETHRRRLTLAGELRTVLEDHLHVTLPDSPTLDEALERISAIEGPYN